MGLGVLIAVGLAARRLRFCLRILAAALIIRSDVTGEGRVVMTDSGYLK